MLEPDWNQERPSFSEISLFWKGDVFTNISYSNADIENVIIELEKSHVNGGCKIFCAEYIEHPTLHWFVSRNRFEELEFFEHYFKTESFRNNGIKFDLKKDKLEWEWLSPFILDGDIARTLKSGGAYEAFKGSGKEAKDLGVKFYEALFGDRYEDIELFKTYEPWSNWFYDVAWDQTWVCVDKQRSLIWAILLTDTD